AVSTETRSLPGWLRSLLPPVVQAVADKELKYYFRDPAFKASLVAMLYSFMVLGIMWLGLRHDFQTGDDLGSVTKTISALKDITLWLVVLFATFSGNDFSSNIFGSEGVSASVLFLFPGSRKQILFGKNLAYFVAVNVVNAGVLLLLAILTKRLPLYPVLLGCVLLGSLLVTAAGNLTSIWFPRPRVRRGERGVQMSAGQGCGIALLSMLFNLLIVLCLLPVAAAFVVPLYWAPTWWLLVTVPLALGYATGLYLLSLRLATPLLLQREEAIIQKLVPEE
ncbi:MAG TPA: hypothetical protein VGM23_04445, partial [Armatimonadota bacterium]